MNSNRYLILNFYNSYLKQIDQREREREKNTIILDEKIMIMENGMYCVKIRHEDQEMLKRNRVIE